jgi:hypothetical protein
MPQHFTGPLEARNATAVLERALSIFDVLARLSILILA